MASPSLRHSIPNKKGEVDELRTLLRAPENQRDPKKYLQAVQKVIAYMTIGVDISQLFSDMIMAGASTNLVQKKLVYHYICTYAQSHSELTLLTVNTLTKDSQDQNPVVRGLALRSMCSLRIANLVDYVREPLKAGLQDRSPYVRRTAVMGCVKLYYVTPEVIKDLNLVDILYRMLRDKDTQVISNCISALNEILASEGGMVINRNIAHYLLNRLKEFNEWGQNVVMKVLLHYSPVDSEEMYDILNVLDDRLNHTNSSVVMSAVALFLRLTEDYIEMHSDVYERIKSPLLTFLGSDIAELVYACLQHLQMIIARQPDLMKKDFKSFYCRYKDPPYLKIKKIELLTELLNNHNANDIVEEIGEYASDVHVLIACKAIQALGTMALRLPEHVQTCTIKLMSLMSLNIDYITAEIFVAFTKILRTYEVMLDMVLSALPQSVDSVATPEGKAAFIWILGEYGELLSNSPYILEEVSKHISEEESSLVKLSLLTAMMKLFFKRPPECQEMLGRLLEYAIDEETDMDVHDRGMLYYRLLKLDVKEAKRVVCGTNAKTVTEENKVLPRLTLFGEFNTLSVMYEDAAENFIEQKPPFMLQKDNASTTSLKGELEFDAVRFSSVERSGSACSSPSIHQPQSQTDDSGAVRVADLLGDLDLSPAAMPLAREERTPSILLNPEASILPSDFEKKWFSLRLSDEMKVELAVVPTPEELSQTMKERFVFTMASSPADHVVMKFFFYSQHVSTMDYFLVEALLDKAKRLLCVSVKAENPNLAEPFTAHFRESLIGKWMTQLI